MTITMISMALLQPQQEILHSPQEQEGSYATRTTTAVKTSTKRMKVRSFKLNRVYLVSFKLSKVSEFSWSFIYKDFIQV